MQVKFVADFLVYLSFVDFCVSFKFGKDLKILPVFLSHRIISLQHALGDINIQKIKHVHTFNF